MSSPLEPNAEAMRRLVDAALERVIEHLTTLESQGVSDMAAGADRVVELLDEPLPEEGVDYEPLLDLLFRDVIPSSLNTASPGHLSYIPNGGLFHAAVAELVTMATNRYVAYWAAAPGLAQLELTALRWLADMVGYPETSGGVLTSGGSIANLMAVVCARRDKLADDFLNGTLYASDQMHHSVRKAAVLAGFPPANLRVLRSDSDRRLDPRAVSERVKADREAGREPFLVVATAGTTNAGTVDDLAALAELCRAEGLWLHVDAAYGGFFLLTERGRAVMRGIDRADSVLLDPHKSLFLPFGTGSLLVRDRERLRRAHLVHSDYISAAVEAGEAAGAFNFADHSPEMSRASRGLRLWLPLKLLGANAFRDCLDEKLDLATWCEAQLRRRPDIELLAPTDLSTVTFRVCPPGATERETDALNQRVLAGVNRRGRAHLSHTLLDGREAIRICILSFRTHRTHLEACLADLDDAISEELGRRRGGAEPQGD